MHTRLCTALPPRCLAADTALPMPQASTHVSHLVGAHCQLRLPRESPRTNQVKSNIHTLIMSNHLHCHGHCHTEVLHRHCTCKSRECAIQVYAMVAEAARTLPSCESTRHVLPMHHVNMPIGQTPTASEAIHAVATDGTHTRPVGARSSCRCRATLTRGAAAFRRRGGCSH